MLELNRQGFSLRWGVSVLASCWCPSSSWRRSTSKGILFFGPDGSLMSSKWNQVKAVLRYCDGIAKPIVEPQFAMFFDLGSDPGENYNLFEHKLDMGWMFRVTFGPIAEYKQSLVKYPNIEPGSEFKGYLSGG